MTMQNRGDEFYTLVASPLGDKLTVQVYDGPFGVFKVGAGDRKIKDIHFQGNFYGPNMFFTIGQSVTSPGGKPVTECKLPVGDYTTFHLTIDYGGLRAASAATIPNRSPATSRIPAREFTSAPISPLCSTSPTSRRSSSNLLRPTPP